MSRDASPHVPSAMRPTCDAIVALTDAFCAERLTPDYAALCREMAAALARERPSPLQRGQPRAWASGIVHAAASHNGLFDRDDPHHLSAAAIATAFGVSASTDAVRARAVREALHIGARDREWMVPETRAFYERLAAIAAPPERPDLPPLSELLVALARELHIVPFGGPIDELDEVRVKTDVAGALWNASRTADDGAAREILSEVLDRLLRRVDDRALATLLEVARGLREDFPDDPRRVEHVDVFRNESGDVRVRVLSVAGRP